MKQATAYPLRSYLPGQLHKIIIGLSLLDSVILLVAYFTGYLSRQLVALVVLSSLVILGFQIFRLKSNQYYLRFLENRLKYHLPFDTGEISYDDIEKVEIKEDSVIVRSNNYPLVIDLHYAYSEQEAASIKHRFKTLQNETLYTA